MITDAMVEAAVEVAYLRNRDGAISWSDLSAQHKSDWREKVRPVVTAAFGAAWRPIETAPRDGSRVILFTRWSGGDFCPEAFDEVQIGYWDEGFPTNDMWHRDPQWVTEKIGTPTHWMPLPRPPKGVEG